MCTRSWGCKYTIQYLQTCFSPLKLECSWSSSFFLSGKFGQVYRMSHKETGDICAGKFYRARTSKDKAAALREIELMNCLHHPKLVQCLAAYNTRSEIVMVME